MADRDHGADPLDYDEWFENNMSEVCKVTDRVESERKSSVTKNQCNGAQGSDHPVPETYYHSTSTGNAKQPPSYHNHSSLMGPRSVSSSSSHEPTQNQAGPSQSQQSSNSFSTSPDPQNSDKLPAKQLFGSKESTPKNRTDPSTLPKLHRREIHVDKLQNRHGQVQEDRLKIQNNTDMKRSTTSMPHTGNDKSVQMECIENRKKRRHEDIESTKREERHSDSDQSSTMDEFVEKKEVDEMKDEDGEGEGEAQNNVQQSLTQQDIVDFEEEESEGHSGREDTKPLVQQTLSQHLKPIASPTPPLSKERRSVLLEMWRRQEYIDYKENTYFRGSYWELSRTKPSLRNVVVKLLDLSLDSDGNLIAVVDSSAFYVHLQHTYLDEKCAMKLIEGGFPAYVRYLLHFKKSGDDDTVRIPLGKLQTGVAEECLEATKWEFGYDGVNKNGRGRMDKSITATRGGCYFRYFGTDRAGSCPDLSPDGMPTVFDLYCGAGGMTKGYHQEGFKTSFAIENNDSAADAYASNFPEVNLMNCDVQKFVKDLEDKEPSCPNKGSIWVGHASPSCKGFSTENRYGGKNDEANRRGTSYALDVAERLLPIVWTYEMVEGILYDRHHDFFHEEVLLRLLKLGYQVRLASLNAAAYGAPQNRWRVIIIAIKIGFPLPDRPAPTHGSREGLSPPRTAEDALGFLEGVAPSTKPFLTVCASLSDDSGQERSLYLYNHFLRENQKIIGNPEDHDRDCTRILAHNPVPTVTGEHETLHYDTKLKRWLTILEHALLQGFPPEFKFRGKDKEKRSQIGNAVPPPLARAIARTVYKAIEPFILSMRQQQN